MARSSLVIVADEDRLAQVLQTTLDRLGYRVHGVATTGPDALNLIGSTAPDLILMDMHLRGPLDAIEIAEIVRRDYRVPVVFLTAHSDDLTITRAQAATSYGYLVQPFQQRELRAAIETALSRAEIETRLQRVEQWLAATLTSIGDAVVATDPRGRIMFFNPVAEKLSGWLSQDAIGQAIQEVIIVQDTHTSTPLRHPVTRVLEQGTATSPTQYSQLVRRDGTTVPITDSATPILDDRHALTGVVMVFRDSTSQHAIEQKLHFAAMHDTLTNLPNRALLQDRLQLACAELQRYPDRKFSLLFLDIDHFKLINDSLGHILGDRVLIEVAARLSACTRACDTVARMSGDEFVLLLTSVSEPHEVLRIAERIHQIIGEPFLIDGHHLYCTTSIGIRLSDPTDDSVESMLRDADAALYHAKALGRSQSFMFEAALHQAVVSQLALETDLRRAWREQQFSLVYQPIQVLQTGVLHGFEVLLRWQHPRRGMVGPQEFIPVLEETGLVIEVGAWVMRESCRQFAAWRASGRMTQHVILSINLSVRQFYHPQFVESVAEALRSADLPPHILQLEITESIILSDLHIQQTLHALRELGVGLSLDDFGTGYSSLSALHDLPITTVKIDRAFVQAFGQADRRRSMVRAILLLAQELALEVVAEGIETEDQHAALRAIGCPYGQGFLFARPMDVATLNAWLPSSDPAPAPS